MNVIQIQDELRKQSIDGWLLYDFQGLNPLAREIAGIGNVVRTRRWFCLLRPDRQPEWLVSRIERGHFRDVPGTVFTYLSWKSLRDGLANLLNGCSTIAMEYSPSGTIPAVSRVDGGTLELVVETGVELVSSANLIQACQSRLTPKQLAYHMEASRHLSVARERAFRYIAESFRDDRTVTEYDVQQQIVGYFEQHGLVWNGPPIVAFGRNSGDPHYLPTENRSAVIEADGLLLIDLWAKLPAEGAVYADITWMGYTGSRVPEDIARLFHIVTSARDAAVKVVQEAVAERRQLRGYEVDDAARFVIGEAGHLERFIHRTGHNIGVEVHGSGVNFDNFETHDERVVIPDVCCSVEPGLYFDHFGMRSEVNLSIGARSAEITTSPVQQRVVPILRESS